METTERTIDATTDDGDMAVVIAEPAAAAASGGDWPTILLFIDAPGLRPATREFMARLSAEGYRVVTPDLHHRQGRLLYFEPADIAQDPSRRDTMMGWIAAMTDGDIQADMDAALATADVGADEPLAVIGFCLGARAVYRAMERLPQRVRAGAGWHPSFLVDDAADSPHLSAAQLANPLYLGIGEADQSQSIAMHQKFLDAVAPLDHVDVTTFAGAEHGFSWPGYPAYHEVAAETSWAKTLAMFSAALSAT